MKAFKATRPTLSRSRMPAMPVTTVRKITGAMIIFTSLMKPSPSGLRLSPTPGQKWPMVAPQHDRHQHLEIQVPIERLGPRGGGRGDRLHWRLIGRPSGRVSIPRPFAKTLG